MPRGRLLAVVSIVATLLMIVPASVGAAPQGAPKSTYNLYFGDLHTHTAYSDAYVESTPWDAYAAAIAQGADFMAVTDHIAIWHDYQAWVLDQAEWQDELAAANYFTSKKFVAMPGYEAYLLGHCGEINVYNAGLPPAVPEGYKWDRLDNFYDWIASTPGAVGQFNHPLYVSTDFLDFAGYTPARDVGMGMIEVWNEDIYDADYIMALDAGWHLMPTANSDTHYTDWMSGEMRDVLLAPSLTPANLYAAMSQGRGYATLDKNLRVYYTLDGAVMGSNLSAPDGSYTASIQISDPDGVKDEITLVEIVSDGGRVVKSIPTKGTSIDLTVKLNSDSARYFFVRITTASPLEGAPGLTAWTSPVWTGR